jgi:hypothetical protein
MQQNLEKITKWWEKGEMVLPFDVSKETKVVCATTENTQKKQYQDVEVTDQLPGLAEYLTRHSKQ